MTATVEPRNNATEGRSRSPLNWLGWMPLVVLPTLTMLLPSTWPPWVFMWMMSVGIYGSCKLLTWWSMPHRRVPVWRHVAYLFAWPGMDAIAFLDPSPPGRVNSPSVREWLLAAVKLALGVMLLFGVTRWIPLTFPYCVGWVGMIGIILTLHFGLFHLLSCVWRSMGIDAKPLMNWPLAASGLSDFWGRRWNTAFRDLTYQFLYRPLASRFGARGALFVGFVFSGFVHDLVISVPSRGGYGGPSVYFTMQGVAIAIERSPLGRQLGFGRGWRGWCFAALVLFGPVCVLFHPPFVVRVIVPFLQAIKAIE